MARIVCLVTLFLALLPGGLCHASTLAFSPVDHPVPEPLTCITVAAGVAATCAYLRRRLRK